MATPAGLMARLDGLVGNGLRAARAPQRVTLWKNCMREIMFSQGLRDATDWEIVSTNDAVAADTVLDATGGTIYGVLVDSIFDVAAERLSVIVGDLGGAYTLAGAAIVPAAGDTADGVAILNVETAADVNNAVFGTWLNPSGAVCTNDIHVSADGAKGTDPTSLDVRVYVVYRDTAEVQV